MLSAALFTPLFVHAGFAADPVPSRPDTAIFELASPISDPANFNWFSPSSRREDGAQQGMWEPLFHFDYATGQLQPWLGLSLTPDATQTMWTLTLRDGVEWSDTTKAKPQPFTATDVVFTTQLVLDHPEINAYEAVRFRSQVASVTLAGPLAVTFRLKQPNPRFGLDTFGGTMFSSLLIMPQHVWSKRDAKTALLDYKFDKPIGTGPYELDDPQPKTDPVTGAPIDPHRQVFWTRNEEWWGAKPDLNGKPYFHALPEPLMLEWFAPTNKADSLSELMAGAIDASREYSPSDYAQAIASPKIVGWDNSLAWNDPCARQLDINTTEGNWTDPRLRRALSLLIDRTRLAHDAYGGLTTPSATMFASYGAMAPFIDAVTATPGLGVSPTADVIQAQQLLIDAGYSRAAGEAYFSKGGKVLTATIVVPNNLLVDVDGANALSDQMRAAGIDAHATSVSPGEYWGDMVPTGKYEMAYGWLSCGSVAEPFTSMARYLVPAKPIAIGDRTPGFSNTGRWYTAAAKQYSATVEQIGTLPLGDAGILPLVTQAYGYLRDEMPFIPLVQSPRLIAFNDTYWTGWPTASACTNPPVALPAPVPGGKAPACTVPMHDWQGTEALLFQLAKPLPPPP